MKRKVAVILIALVLAAATLLCGCNEIEKGESTWTPSHGDPEVKPKATATEDQLVAFGAYPNTVAPNEISTAFKNIKIDDVTGLWVEEETERKDGEGNVIGKTVCKYDIQTGYYVREETVNGETTVTYYAKEGNKFYLVQEIQWIILKDLGDSYLLVSRELLDAKPMMDAYGQGTWEESTLRDWLNGTDDYARGGEKFVESWNFFDRAFSEEERAALRSVTNVTADNAMFGTPGGNTTTDLVYTFSAEELNDAFGTISKQAATTPYAAKRGVVAEYKTRLGSWWIRSSGMNTYFQGIDRKGDLSEGGFASNDKTIGVRPVITVAKSAVRTIDNTLPTAGPIETPTPNPTVRPTEKSEG